jgi:hypothetical protein
MFSVFDVSRDTTFIISLWSTEWNNGAHKTETRPRELFCVRPVSQTASIYVYHLAILIGRSRWRNFADRLHSLANLGFLNWLKNICKIPILSDFVDSIGKFVIMIISRDNNLILERPKFWVARGTRNIQTCGLLAAVVEFMSSAKAASM